MRFDTTPDYATFGWKYVPHCYGYWLYQSYFRPPKTEPLSLSGPSHGNYDFSSDIVPVPGTASRQTVEQIVAHGYFAVPVGRPETAIISDKEHTSRLGLEGSIQQIRQRYEIYERNTYEIELAKCDTLTAFFAREAERGFTLANDREAYSLNKGLQGLYQQQRDERVKLWQDVSKLKESLPEVAQQYLASHRRVSILSDQRGDAP